MKRMNETDWNGIDFISVQKRDEIWSKCRGIRDVTLLAERCKQFFIWLAIFTVNWIADATPVECLAVMQPLRSFPLWFAFKKKLSKTFLKESIRGREIPKNPQESFEIPRNNQKKWIISTYEVDSLRQLLDYNPIRLHNY